LQFVQVTKSPASAGLFYWACHALRLMFIKYNGRRVPSQ